MGELISTLILGLELHRLKGLVFLLNSLRAPFHREYLLAEVFVFTGTSSEGVGVACMESVLESVGVSMLARSSWLWPREAIPEVLEAVE